MESSICYNVLSLNASGYAQVTNNFNLNLNGSRSFTVSAWVYFKGFGVNTEVITQENGFNLYCIDNKIFAQIGNRPAVYSDPDKVKLKNNNWHYITYVFEAPGTQYLYIDGEFCSQSMISGLPLIDSNKEIFLGKTLQGLIRRMRVYNNALSAGDVHANSFEEAMQKEDSRTVADINFGLYPVKNGKDSTTKIQLCNGAEQVVVYPAVKLKDTACVIPFNDEMKGYEERDTQDYTIQGWVYTNGLFLKQYIFSNSANEANSGVSLLLKRMDFSQLSTPKYRVILSRGCYEDINSLYISNKTVNASEWIHIAVTYDGTTSCMYINGELDGSEVSPPLAKSDNNRIIIGGMRQINRPTASSTFKGYISRIQIWDRALNASEIKEYMHEEPVWDTHYLANYGFETNPARNSVSGTPLSLIDNAEIFLYSKKCTEDNYADELMRTRLKPGGYQYEHLHNDHVNNIISSVRSSHDFTKLGEEYKEPLNSILNKENLKYNDWAELIAPDHWEAFKKDLSKHTNRIQNRITENPHLFTQKVTHHRVGENYLFIHHTVDESKIIYSVPALEISECSVWKITLVFTIILGFMSVFGITAQLGEKLGKFIQNKVLTSRPVMWVISKFPETSGSGRAMLIFNALSEMHKYGMLWPMCKAVLSSVSWWTLVTLSIEIISCIVGTKVASTIASLAITALAIAHLFIDKPDNCQLVLE